MKYWFIIKGSLPTEEARQLWNKLAQFRANFTVLFDRAYVYGDTEEPQVVQYITRILMDTGYPVERG